MIRRRAPWAVAVTCAAANVVSCEAEVPSAAPAGQTSAAPSVPGGGGSRLDLTPSATEVGAAPAPDRLEPSADCTQPAVRAECAAGHCRIPPGCFVMGAPRDEPGAGLTSNVQAQVTLSHGFWMTQTEVTREQWAAAGWGMPRRDVLAGSARCSTDQCPIDNVSFFDAIRYANWRSESEGLPACYRLEQCTGSLGADLKCDSVLATSPSVYECRGYRLPTEAEWEYAARAGTKSATYSGALLSEQLGECVPEPALEAIAWYCNNSEQRAHAVAEKAPNGWGLYDMLGNLYEWCSDLRDGLGYGQGPLVDPPGRFTPGQDLFPRGPDGLSTLEGRVMRGGNHVSAGDACTAADRGAGSSHLGSSGVGFRLVRTDFPS